MTWTPGALSHDHGGRRGGMYCDDYGAPHTLDGKGRNIKPRVHWTPTMRAAAVAVLALPVTVRDEPAARCGEFTARAA